MTATVAAVVVGTAVVVVIAEAMTVAGMGTEVVTVAATEGATIVTANVATVVGSAAAGPLGQRRCDLFVQAMCTPRMTSPMYSHATVTGRAQGATTSTLHAVTSATAAAWASQLWERPHTVVGGMHQHRHPLLAGAMGISEVATVVGCRQRRRGLQVCVCRAQQRALHVDAPGLFAPGDWTCTGCGNVNWARRGTCNKCNTPKPGTMDMTRDGAKGGFREYDEAEIEEARRRRQENDDKEMYDEYGRLKKQFRRY